MIISQKPAVPIGQMTPFRVCMFTSLYSGISKLFWGVAMYGLCFHGIKVHFVDGSKGSNIG